MTNIKTLAVACLALAGLVGVASAQTITVDLATDDFDVPWPTATMGDLPGPDGRVFPSRRR